MSRSPIIPLADLARTLRERVGANPNALSRATRETRSRLRGIAPTVSVCPYCAVGCSQLVYVDDGRVSSIEGNPASPINAGTLCPKGAATTGLLTSPLRVTTARYRAPFSTEWEERPLEWAMARIARLVKETRDAGYEETDGDGHRVNRTLAIGHLGGATLDNEENYLIKKLFTGGLGIVAVENQARI
jgi:formate dehydrogenase major subunit